MLIDKYRKCITITKKNWWTDVEEKMQELFYEIVGNLDFKVGDDVTLDIRILVEHKGEK